MKDMRTARELLTRAAERLACNPDDIALADEIVDFLDTPVVQITNPYKEFYELPEEQRIALIGSMLVENRTGYPVIYFPVGLDDETYNYNVAQGLISVHPVHIDRKDGAWFKVGAFSPDDLDIDLEFTGQEVELHDQVVQFMRTLHKHDVSYRGVLKTIQRHFEAGTM